MTDRRSRDRRSMGQVVRGPLHSFAELRRRVPGSAELHVLSTRDQARPGVRKGRCGSVATRTRVGVSTYIGIVLVVMLAVSEPAPAQFMYLDSNGDGLSSRDDVLNPQGVPTSIAVYLDTSRNADGLIALCSTGAESLSLNSYEFILRATGGTVAFGAYANARPSMVTPFGQRVGECDYVTGFGGEQILQSGLYHLGTITVTVVSGSPTLVPVTSTVLDPRYGTSFGTQCLGVDGDNTFRLGLDWYGVAGCGPAGGGNYAPASIISPSTTVSKGRATCIVAEFSDLDATAPLAVSVSGLPPGFTATSGAQVQGRKQLRAYGVLPETTQTDSVYKVDWLVSDGITSNETRTALRVRDALGSSEFEQRVTDFVLGKYQHGMPRKQMQQFGSRALPILARCLREVSLKPYWAQAAAGIGFVGDTAYFDTLRAFVWSTFQGEVDRPTYIAMRYAQVSLSAMATVSHRVLNYLESTKDPEAWHGLPWTTRGMATTDLSRIMADQSVIALGYTDSERAQQVLELMGTGEGGRTQFLQGVLRVNALVRVKGYLKVWEEQDVPTRN
jgi:hypothetical protein